MIVQDALLSSDTAALAHLPDSLSVSVIQQPSSVVYGPDARAAHPDKIHWELPLSPDMEFLLPVNIIHSSGSTGFPKAVTWNNKTAVGNCKINLGLTALMTMPLYHVGLFLFIYSLPC